MPWLACSAVGTYRDDDTTGACVSCAAGYYAPINGSGALVFLPGQAWVN